MLFQTTANETRPPSSGLLYDRLRQRRLVKVRLSARKVLALIAALHIPGISMGSSKRLALGEAALRLGTTVKVAVHRGALASSDDAYKELIRSLQAAACELVTEPEGSIDAVVALGDVEGSLQLAVHLREAGYRGVIVSVCPESPESEVHALRTAGVNGIVTAEEEATDAVLRHVRNTLGETPSTDLEFSLDENTRRIRIGVLQAVLTEAQFKLLACLIERPGTWFKARDLVLQAFGTHHDADSPLVRVHMNAIRKVLGIARWCLQSERTFGYQFLTNPDALPGLGSRRTWSRSERTAIAQVLERRSGSFRVGR